MKLFTTIYDDARLLGPFLRHYHALGVSDFLIAVSTQCATAVDEFAASYNITVFKGLDVKSHMLGGTAAVSEMRRTNQDPDEWVVAVDLDEFIEPFYDFDFLISSAESEGANVIRGIMYDRFSSDGSLAEVRPDSDPATIFPVRARFIRNVMAGLDHKGVLIRGHLRPAIAHHQFDGEIVASTMLELAHYKWCLGAIDRLRARHQELLERGINFAGEYKKILDHYDQHGRFVWQEFGGEVVFHPMERSRMVLQSRDDGS
jgi:hypothetical protein